MGAGVTSYGYDRHMYDVHTPHLIVALKVSLERGHCEELKGWVSLKRY